MAYDYTGLQGTATRLLASYGRAMSLRSQTYTTPNTATPWNKTVTNADLAITGVVEDYRQAEVDGTKIKQGDKRILVAGSITTAPAAGKQIVDGAVVYTIQDVTTLQPGGTALLYVCQVRL